MKINKIINHKKLWIDSMSGMSMGFFSLLIIGSLMGIFGLYSNQNIFIDTKKILTALTPFGIGIGIGITAKRSLLQSFAIAIAATMVAHSLMITKMVDSSIVLNQVSIGLDTGFHSPGDVLAAWIAGVFMLYFFEIFIWEKVFDFLLLPLIGIAFGLLNSLWITYLVSLVSVVIEFAISSSADQSLAWAIVLAPIIGMIMGLALTLPISSAALALAIKIHGNAGIAAIAGTTAQMVSFGLLTWWATKSWPKTIAVGLGTSMLHINNYSRKPILLAIPTIASAFAALIGVAAFHGTLPFDPNGAPTTGMGSAVLYGQIYTLKENGWTSLFAWLNIVFVQLLTPFMISLPLLYLASQKHWIRKEWLQLWNNTQLNIFPKPVKS